MASALNCDNSTAQELDVKIDQRQPDTLEFVGEAVIVCYTQRLVKILEDKNKIVAAFEKLNYRIHILVNQEFEIVFSQIKQIVERFKKMKSFLYVHLGYGNNEEIHYVNSRNDIRVLSIVEFCDIFNNQRNHILSNTQKIFIFPMVEPNLLNAFKAPSTDGDNSESDTVTCDYNPQVLPLKSNILYFFLELIKDEDNIYSFMKSITCLQEVFEESSHAKSLQKMLKKYNIKMNNPNTAIFMRPFVEYSCIEEFFFNI